MDIVGVNILKLKYIIQRWELTEEGKKVVSQGSHEAVVWGLVSSDGISQQDLMKAAGAVGKVMSNNVKNIGDIVKFRLGSAKLCLQAGY